MSIDPNGIPRYAPPTPAELAAMFADPTPADVMADCPHRWACRMQLERLGGRVVDESDFGWTDELAALLGCGEDCECAE